MKFGTQIYWVAKGFRVHTKEESSDFFFSMKTVSRFLVYYPDGGSLIVGNYIFDGFLFASLRVTLRRIFAWHLCICAQINFTESFKFT